VIILIAAAGSPVTILTLVGRAAALYGLAVGDDPNTIAGRPIALPK
jgi:hypothetical protein